MAYRANVTDRQQDGFEQRRTGGGILIADKVMGKYDNRAQSDGGGAPVTDEVQVDSSVVGSHNDKFAAFENPGRVVIVPGGYGTLGYGSDGYGV